MVRDPTGAFSRDGRFCQRGSVGASPAGPADSQKGGGLTVRARNGASRGKLGCWCRRGHGLEGEEGGCHRRVTKGITVSWSLRRVAGLLTLVMLASLPQRRVAPTRLHTRPRCLGEAHGWGGRASKGRLWREVGPLLMYSRGTVECGSQTHGANVLVSADVDHFPLPAVKAWRGTRWALLSCGGGGTGRRPP